MTRPIRKDEPESGPADPGFDFGSPRWREPTARDQADAAPARQRRFRNDAPPTQRGSIDAEGSVQGERRQGGDATPASPGETPSSPGETRAGQD